MSRNRFVHAMSRRKPLWGRLGVGMVLFCLLVIIGCPPSTEPEIEPQADIPALPDKPLISELNNVEQSIFWRVNEERRKNGFRPLTLKADLCRAARKHNFNMMQLGMVTHFSPEGADIGQQLTAQGIPWNLCAENLAKMSPSSKLPQNTVDFWMSAPSGRKDMLFHLYNETGISAMRDPRSGAWFITQIYARRTSYWID